MKHSKKIITNKKFSVVKANPTISAGIKGKCKMSN